MLQNVNEVNRERSRFTAESSVYDSTKHNGPITQGNGMNAISTNKFGPGLNSWLNS